MKVTRKNIIKTKKLQSKVYKKFKFSIDDIIRKQLNKLLYERRKINYSKMGKKYNRNIKTTMMVNYILMEEGIY